MIRPGSSANPISSFLRVAAGTYVIVVFFGIALAGCNVRQKGSGKNEKVDIETPIGSVHVNTQVDPKDTGLSVYPGARQASETAEDHDAAKVNIDSSILGVKVIAVKFDTDAAPSAVLDYYRKQLKQYGEISECQGDLDFRMQKDGTHVAHCNPGARDHTELMVGSPDRHRIVSVKPKGSGSQFALVYVQTRGERGTL